MITGKESFEDAVILDVEICSNGIMGGDGGHGGFCKIILKSTSQIHVRKQSDYELEICVTGDAERRTLRDAFRYMAEYLDQQLK